MVTRVFKLFTADILMWKSNYDLTLFFEHPSIRSESQARPLLLCIGLYFL